MFNLLKLSRIFNLSGTCSISIAFILASSSAFAAPWSFSEDTRFCAASSVKDDGTVFGLRFPKSQNGVHVSAYNGKWYIPFRSIEITAEFHGKMGIGSFTIDAKVLEQNSIDLARVENIDAFLGAIANSDVLLLKDNEGSVLASFSLEGSRKALFEAMKCQGL